MRNNPYPDCAPLQLVGTTTCYWTAGADNPPLRSERHVVRRADGLRSADASARRRVARSRLAIGDHRFAVVPGRTARELNALAPRQLTGRTAPLEASCSTRPASGAKTSTWYG
jgi:hypothetical protein